MNDAKEAIADIQKEFKENGSPIKIKSQGQEIMIGEPGYDSMYPQNNKGTPIYSDNIWTFIKDTSLSDQKALQDSVGGNIVGKRVKNFKFYTDIPFNKEDNTIIYKDREYEIIYISTVNIQQTDILYELVGAN